MKSAEFDYVRPSTLDEVCAHLAKGDDEFEWKILAGGQTLVPLMAMRLARPTHLIDINRIDALQGVDITAERVVIGAATRQRVLERTPGLNNALPLIALALPHIGHIQTRNRGTIGGSIAHADSSAEIPLVTLILDGSVTLKRSAGERVVPVRDLFLGPMETTIEPDELMVSIELPVWNCQDDHGVGAGFHEMAPRKGDFAIASAAAQVELDANGVCVRAAIGVGGCAPTPLRLEAAEVTLIGQIPSEARIADAVLTANDQIDPESTLQASAGYRRRVCPELAKRAILDAVADAKIKAGS
ncbi:MAG: FAD binding domain-containing protein [Alphaproteobacteria bacterium]|jgi:CO/xanthine dehydrogenase FAD-binding subunit